MSERGASLTVSPNAGEVQNLLHTRYPGVFHKNDGSIPVHIECSGQIPPLGMEQKIVNPFTTILFWTYHANGKVAVSILLDDKGDKRTVHVPFRKSRTESFLFIWPFVIPVQHDWPAIHGNIENVAGLYPIFSELVASGVVKALNRMTPDDLSKLVAGTHRTEEQKSLLQWLTASPTKTFSVKIDEAGAVFFEAEHEFVPVFVDFAERRKLPTIVSQAFDASTRRGSVVADVTGCDERIAVDYLLGRFVPAICRTKSVVFDPSEAPPGGAVYSVRSHVRNQKNGKDVVRIEFESIQ